MNNILEFVAFTALAGATAASTAQAATLETNATAYALGQDGTSLVTLATPDDTMTSSVALSFGAAMPVTLEAIAYRPQNMQLYGYDNGTNAVYEIDVSSGMTTFVAGAVGATRSGRLGFDFNNVIDAARIVTRDDRNLVFFPNKTPPTLERKTDLFYIAGDANEGADPGVVMNAYTNAIPDASTTLQYVIDVDQNVLATLDNNAGALMTVGKLTLDGEEFNAGVTGGMDILSFREGDNTAFGLLTDERTGTQGLYGIDLSTGTLSFINDAPTGFGRLTGFAVVGSAVDAAPVPLPAALPMLAVGMGSLAWMRRRRTRAG